METGRGKKHPQKEEIKAPERIKIDAILDAADKAIDSLNIYVTAEEREELYYDAIQFALKREFPDNMVETYMKEIIKEKKNLK